MAPLCKYFAKGECRYGDRCKFEHPRDLQNNNRFLSFQNEYNPINSGRLYRDGRSSLSIDPTFGIKRETIIADLSTEHPQWILSAYAPAPKAPAQLFGGPLREQSFEEMRMHFYNGIANGTLVTAREQTDALIREAVAQMRNTLNDVDGAINFIRRAQNEHPNRIDICESYMKNLGQPLLGHSSTGAGQVAPTQNPSMNSGPLQPSGIFGQRPSLESKPDPFGTFGQSSRLESTATFGQSSTLGQKPNPFGAVGGANSRGPAPFSFAATSNPFGGPPQPIGPNPFGPPSQPAQPAQLNPFGQTVPTVGPNSFSQITTPGSFTQAAVPSPFSQASTSSITDPFGHLRQADTFRPILTTDTPNTNAFRRTGPPSPPSNPDPFGQPMTTPPANPFGQQPGVQSTLSVSNSSSTPRQTELVANGVIVNGPYAPNAVLKHPPLQSYSSQDASQRLIMFKGKPVVYKDSEAGTRNRDGSWEKIWFPNGPPVYSGATEMDNDVYSEGITAAYLHLRETGEFQGGIMPFLPPKREWCLWDF